MASAAIVSRHFSKLRNFSSFIRTFTGGKIIYNKQGKTSSNIPSSVPGLSQDVVNVPNEPVGPGAAKNTAYKNPEYFCYDKNSYYQAEIEMAKYRCPQPSTKIY